MILNISKVRSVAAGYICTCSELITKLQRTSYAKAWWEDTITVEHYYWRLWQDPKPLICYCKLTITAENEEVWQGRADSQLADSPSGHSSSAAAACPPGEAAPKVTQVSLHTLGTQAPPPLGRGGKLSQAAAPCQWVQHCPRAPLSIRKHLVQQSRDPAQGRTCPQPPVQEASAYNDWICMFQIELI